MSAIVRLLSRAFLGSALASLAWAAPADLPRIFGDVPPGTQVGLTGTDSQVALRARAVLPDVDAIADIAARAIEAGEKPHFVLDLFPGLTLDAETMSAERRATGMTVIARLSGVEMGTAVLTVDQGVLTATINYVGGDFLLTMQPDGTYRLAEIDRSKLPPEAPPLVPPVAPTPAPSFPRASAFDVPIDSGRLIDVLIVWDAAAETAQGGANKMASLAQSAVDNANAAYLNSGIAQRLRLVWKQAVAYVETSSCANPHGAGAFGCALDALTTGSIANVNALRNTYGADLVSIFIADFTLCGIAWQLDASHLAGTPDYAFSVVNGKFCAISGVYAFAHETGHNMGAHHDPYVLNAGTCPDGLEPGAFCYSRGLVHIGVDAAHSWQTVMAYDDQCLGTFGDYCTQLLYFSNPNVKYTDGNAMGDAAYRNNALTLNKTAKTVANYRNPPAVAVTATYPAFTDVPTTAPLYGYVEFMREAQYTGGCVAGMYCPNDNVTRRQMAAFLERVKHAANYNPPATGHVFTDVPAGAQFAGYIEALKADGITSGCVTVPGGYCPNDPVQRDQMAKFILKAKCGSAYVPGPRISTFTDVPNGSTFADYIMKLSALGVTSGCVGNFYCPTSPVSRGAMAKFLERSFPFGEPTELCTP